MRPLIILLLFFQSVIGFSQKVQYFLSINSNCFRDQSDGHFVARGTPMNGYSFGISVDSIQFGPIKKLRLSARIDRYSSGFYLTDGSLGSGSFEIKGESHKTVLAIAAFPIRIQFENFQFNAGPELGVVLKQSSKAVKTTHYIHSPNYTKSLDNDPSLSSKGHFGLRAELGFRIRVGKGFFTPRYGYYYGLLQEFAEYYIKATRHELGISVMF